MDYVYEEDREVVLGAWNTLSTGLPVTFEMRWKGKELNHIGHAAGKWVVAACIPFTDEHGALTSIAGCTTDVSAQKSREEDAERRAEALEQLRAATARFEAFATLSPVALFSFSPDKALTFANEQFFQVTGMPSTCTENIDWRNCISTEVSVLRQNCEALVLIV